MNEPTAEQLAYERGVCDGRSIQIESRVHKILGQQILKPLPGDVLEVIDNAHDWKTVEGRFAAYHCIEAAHGIK